MVIKSVPGSWGSAVKTVLRGDSVGSNCVQQSTFRGVSAPATNNVVLNCSVLNTMLLIPEQ